MQIKPLFRDPVTGDEREAQTGDILSIPALGSGPFDEAVTLLETLSANACCAVIEYTAVSINSVNMPVLNYRSTPAVDCVILESGTYGQTVKAALTHGKLYDTPIQINYTNSDTLYLGRNGLLTTTVPSLSAGDKWLVVVGRLINHFQFIFDPQLPINLEDSLTGGDLPPYLGYNNTVLFTDGLTKVWRPYRASYLIADAAISSFDPTIATYEVGQTVTTPGFTALYNEDVFSVRLKDDQNNTWSILSNFTNFNSENTFLFILPSSVIFTVEATLSSVVTKTTSINWYYRKFWGTSSNFTQIDSLQSSSLSNSRLQTFTVTAATNEYIYLAIPASFGDPVFCVGNIEGGFVLDNTITFTNPYNVEITYNIYRSDNHSLGITTVIVS